MIRLITSIVLALFLSACSDSGGVVVGDGPGNTSNSNSGGATGSNVGGGNGVAGAPIVDNTLHDF